MNELAPVPVMQPASAGRQTRVLLAATSYPADDADWKGLFIRRMLEGLDRRPELALQAWCPPGPRPAGVGPALQGDDGAWLAALARRGGIAHLLRRQPLRGVMAGLSLVRRLRRALRASDAEVFHINWLQNALALPDDGRPALVTALGKTCSCCECRAWSPCCAGVLRTGRWCCARMRTGWCLYWSRPLAT